MITKITVNNIACYKSSVSLKTDKKVNLIYGLNGTGKSILTDYLYDITNPIYSDCSIEGLTTEDVLVYNKSFINDYFYEPENLKGIFTLSKENREVEEDINTAKRLISKLNEEKIQKSDSIESNKSDLSSRRHTAENRIWEIKSNYAGGDRVLEYCLQGLMGSKESLFDHLLNISKTLQKPDKSIDKIKKEVEAIQGLDAQKYGILPIIDNHFQDLESNHLFQKEIVGSDDSIASLIIRKLGNSDWVKKGLDYIPEEIDKEVLPCPFCQEDTITSTLIETLSNYFDAEYDKEIDDLVSLLSLYEEGISSLLPKETYETNVYINDNKNEFDILFDSVIQCLNSNKNKIEEKIFAPSKSISLEKSADKIKSVNEFIASINKAISEHNAKIDNKDITLGNLKDEFWSIMRFDYDQTLSTYRNEKKTNEDSSIVLEKEIDEIESNITKQQKYVEEQQKKTVNIEAAISNINNGLVELGIDGFKIEKHSDRLYKITRLEHCEKPFQTLSEGEKMIISFLYFRELCRGKGTATSLINKKIVVIDDPISSLSHVFIFNISQMIKNDFINSQDYDQVFILTHSLYFFYEMAYTNHKRRKENQKLFRLMKNLEGSKLLDMKYEEIQNDYHSYWYIIKDEKQPPALIANCMRNIIEYFFGFVEKKDFNNVFQKPELQDTKYQAFSRYVNRESHSIGQNIFDLKEFNYTDFKEALGLVFSENGYKEHYDEMMKK